MLLPLWLEKEKYCFGKASKAALLKYSTPDEFKEITADILAATLQLANGNKVGLAKAESLRIKQTEEKIGRLMTYIQSVNLSRSSEGLHRDFSFILQ